MYAAVKTFILIIFLIFILNCKSNNRIQYIFNDYEPSYVELNHFNNSLYLGESEYEIISIDSAKNYYVVDVLLKKIIKFDAYGKKLVEIGEEGFGPNQFSKNGTIRAIHKNQSIYVVEMGGYRVFEYNLSLEYIRELSFDNILLYLFNGYEDTFYVFSQNPSNGSFDFSLEYVNNDLQTIKTITHSSNSQDFFYDILLKLFDIGNEKFMLCYIAKNRCQIQDINSKEDPVYFKVKDVEEKAVNENNFGKLVPKYVLFRDIYYDKKTRLIYFLEGSKVSERYEGGNLVHVFHIDKGYEKSLVLPFNAEQLYIKDDDLYVLKIDSLNKEIVVYNNPTY